MFTVHISFISTYKKSYSSKSLLKKKKFRKFRITIENNAQSVGLNIYVPMDKVKPL